MNPEIYADDLSLAADHLIKKIPVNTVFNTHNAADFSEKYDNYILVSSGDRVGELLAGAMKIASSKDELEKRSFFVDELPSLYDTGEDSHGFELVYEDALPPLDNTAGFITVNCADISSSDALLERAEKLLSFLAKGKGNACVVSVALPSTESYPDGLERLAEREYGYFLEFIEPKTPQREYCAAVEKLCRKYVSQGFERLFLVRCPNVFISDEAKTPDLDIGKIVKEISDTGKVSITDGDFDNVYSFTYAADAVGAMVHLLYNGEKGNIYNFLSFHATPGDIKLSIHREYRKDFALECSCSPTGDIAYHCLDRLKYAMTAPTKSMLNAANRVMTSSQALRRVVADIGGQPINIHESTDIYGGKLDRINSLEMEILREIDRLCEKHGINYFLAGGSMLGAVRNGRNIPWDDDIDIAFLRDDFDKFRKVADSELSDKFLHSCYYNDTKSFYPTDKIRYKDTYFSTRYSSINKVPDGVFVDLLVHDNTSGNELIAHAHREIVFRLRDILERLWQNLRPDQIEKPYKRLAYPLMKKIPLKFYQGLAEKSYVLFRNKKESGKVIDSTGKIIRTAMLPGEEMKTTKKVPFEDGMFPIPEDPVPYLSYVYGDDYIHEPPLSKRAAPHNFARIDLGEHLFHPEKDPDFRDVDLRGELYETDRAGDQRGNKS